MLAQDVPVLPGVEAQHEARRQPSRLEGTRFATLLLEDHQERAAAVAALLAELVGSNIRVLRLNNPRRPDLTLGRILAQVTGSEHKALCGDQVLFAARALTERQAGESRILLIIEQAETLRPEMLHSLQRMAPYFVHDGQPVLQVLFVGHPSFRGLLHGDSLALLRQALGMAGQALAPRVAPLRESTRRQHLAILILLLITVVLAAVGAAYLGRATSLRRDATIPVAIPIGMPPAPFPLARATTAEQPTLPVPIEPRAVPAAPPAPAIPGPMLPELGHQWLAETAHIARPYSPMGNSPANVSRANPGPAMPGLRYVVHVPKGIEDADPALAPLLTALRQRLGTVEVRHVAETPARPSIRYFYAEDEPIARQAATVNLGLAWTLHNFSWFRPLPTRGLVEVWLPRSRSLSR